MPGTPVRRARRAIVQGRAQAHMRVQEADSAPPARDAQQARKERLAEALLRVAEEELGRLRQPLTEHRVSASGQLVRWEEAEPSPSDRRQIMAVIGQAIDKALLLAVEVRLTSEPLSPQELDRALTEIIPDADARRRLALRVVGGGA